MRVANVFCGEGPLLEGRSRLPLGCPLSVQRAVNVYKAESRLGGGEGEGVMCGETRELSPLS